MWVNCKKEWFNVFNPKFGSKQLSGILHKAAWQGILHAEALQLLRRKQMHGKVTPIAWLHLIPLLPALHTCSLLLSQIAHKIQQANWIMVRKQGSNSVQAPNRDKYKFLDHPAAAWTLSEGILILAEVTSQESVQAGPGRTSKYQERGVSPW